MSSEATRQEYTLTEDEERRLREASVPLPMMIVAGRGPPSVEEMVTPIWKEVGERLGFDHMTAVPGQGRNFTAVPLRSTEPIT